MIELKKIKVKGLSEYLEISSCGEQIIYMGKSIKTYLVRSKTHRYGFRACQILGRNFYVHRLVAEAWVPNPRPIVYKMVIHLNGNSLDNSHENLAWGDTAMLQKVRVQCGVSGAGVGQDNIVYRGSSKISFEEAVSIAKRLENGEFAKDICKEYNVSEMSIARIRKRYCKESVASPRYDNTIKQTVLKLSEKYPAGEITRMTGLKYHTVYRWLHSEKVNKIITNIKPKKNGHNPVFKVTHLPPVLKQQK